MTPKPIIKLLGMILSAHPEGPQPDQWLEIREQATAIGNDILRAVPPAETSD